MSARQISSIILPIFLGGLLLAGVLAWYQDSSRSAIQVIDIPCIDISQGCGNSILRVVTDIKPQVMKPFNLTLNLNGSGADEIEVDFAMQEMAMGLNRYHLIARSANAWVAQVVLPVCVQGRSDWLMQISLNQESKRTRYQLKFQANPSLSD